MGGAVTEKPERKSRTPRLDAALLERYHADPKNFIRRTQLSLGLAVLVLILTGALSYFAIFVVKLASGGDSLMLMAIVILFIVIAMLHDVKWRMALVRKESSPVAASPAAKGG
jgi:hypothetical protein